MLVQIVLACDGIWDVMSNEELAEYLLDRLRVSSALDEICRNCLDTCLHKVYSIHYTQYTIIRVYARTRTLAANAGGRGFESHRGQRLFLHVPLY